MNRLLQWLLVLMMLAPLVACGGGGGSAAPAPAAPPPELTLTGSVSDSTQAPVGGATVTVTNAQSGATVATTQTDAAGRYAVMDLPAATALRVGVTGALGYFPSTVQFSLAAGVVSVLDISLASTKDKGSGSVQSASIADSMGTGGTVQSGTFIGAADRAVLTVPPGSLSDAGLAYSGVATVYLTPIDVGKQGNGFAAYQAVLPLAVGDLYPDNFAGQVLELYASAAVELRGAAGQALGSDGTTMLSMPIPADPADLRTNAPATATLWRLDSMGKWQELGSASVDDALAPTAYVAAVDASGTYAVGETVPATLITGQLLYSDGTTPAAGATVYVTGQDVAFQQIALADGNGNFSALVKNGSAASLEYVAWGYGVQLSNSGSIDLATDPAALGAVTLDYAAPVKDSASSVTIRVDDSDLSAPTAVGFILASGRLYVAQDGSGATDALATAEIADLLFVANAFDFDFQAGPVINIEAGRSGANSVNSLGKLRLDSLALPAAITAMTPQGHSAVISISGVTQVSPSAWLVTFSSSYSL